MAKVKYNIPFLIVLAHALAFLCLGIFLALTFSDFNISKLGIAHAVAIGITSLVGIVIGVRYSISEKRFVNNTREIEKYQNEQSDLNVLLKRLNEGNLEEGYLEQHKGISNQLALLVKNIIDKRKEDGKQEAKVSAIEGMIFEIQKIKGGSEA